MEPARWLPERRDGVRLLAVDPEAQRLWEGTAADLPSLLAPHDLLVVNDAATLPAALSGEDERGRAVEARLLQWHEAGTFSAVLFGAGDWRSRTEDRPPPPELAPGARLHFGALAARLAARSPLSPRLVTLSFEAEGDALWAALYRQGRPVQYSYLTGPLPLWAVQTVYGSRPWAMEMPSAGRPLTWEVLGRLRRRGVRWASLTHAAGLSATGDAELDRVLPLPERFEIPAATVRALAETRGRGGRVVAVGTTVVRALEGAAALWGTVRAGQGVTDLRITPDFRPRVVSGILSGVHQPEESHFALLGAFAGGVLLAEAAAHAESRGFRAHELGDSMLVLPGALAAQARAA
jgi:S-adenosylmethionine:tRNA ribosyltransferase-isomerase